MSIIGLGDGDPVSLFAGPRGGQANGGERPRNFNNHRCKQIATSQLEKEKEGILRVGYPRLSESLQECLMILNWIPTVLH